MARWVQEPFLSVAKALIRTQQRVMDSNLPDGMSRLSSDFLGGSGGVHRVAGRRD